MIHPRELFDGDAQRGEVRPAAAVLLRERETEEPELAHLQHDIDGELVVAVPPLGMRSDLGLRELAHESPQRLLFLTQFERCGHDHRS